MSPLSDTRKRKASSGDSAGAALEVLAFTIGAEEYGVDIHHVQELRSYVAVTRIANAPDFIKGVVNLRGLIVPIIDLRLKMGMSAPTYDQFTVVIIVNVAQGVMGMVVDSVSDVALLLPEQIKPAPQLQVKSGSDSGYVTGLGMIDERLLILLDIERLMSLAQAGAAADTAALLAA